jgi:uncharacterized membrane protein
VSWSQRFGVREHLRTALWPVPLVSALAGLLAAAIVWRLDEWGGWTLLGFKAGGATALTAGVVGAMITFIGIVFSALLMAVQFASAQLTPRALKLSLNDPMAKAALGVFVATFMYALIVMARISDDFVPQLALLGVSTLAIVSLLVFLLLVSHISKALRPGQAIVRVGHLGRRTLAQTYPETVGTPGDGATRASGTRPRDTAGRIVPHDGTPGLVRACDVEGLVAEARRANARLVLLPSVGDFVPGGAPLFQVCETGVAVNDRLLRSSVSLGRERTVEQDPTFALRILVDVAIKALSPAVNDPTSAVMALDQLHDLLRFVATRRLDVGEHRDAAGSVRLSVGLPSWEDYVSLAVDEIRQYGASSVQVARRLKAMLGDLIDVAPEERRRALHEELRLLGRAVERTFPDAEDRGRASVANQQGLGSSPPDPDRA